MSLVTNGGYPAGSGSPTMRQARQSVRGASFQSSRSPTLTRQQLQLLGRAARQARAPALAGTTAARRPLQKPSGRSSRPSVPVVRFRPSATLPDPMDVATKVALHGLGRILLGPWGSLGLAIGEAVWLYPGQDQPTNDPDAPGAVWLPGGYTQILQCAPEFPYVGDLYWQYYTSVGAACLTRQALDAAKVPYGSPLPPPVRDAIAVWRARDTPRVATLAVFANPLHPEEVEKPRLVVPGANLHVVGSSNAAALHHAYAMRAPLLVPVLAPMTVPRQRTWAEAGRRASGALQTSEQSRKEYGVGRIDLVPETNPDAAARPPLVIQQPEAAAQPLPAYHWTRPPRGVKEKKFKLSWSSRGKLMSFAGIVGFIGELRDYVDSVWSALPYGKQGFKFVDGRWVAPDGRAKLQAIYDNFDDIRWNKVIENLIYNEVEDTFFGLLGRINGQAAQARGQYGPAQGAQLGDIDTPPRIYVDGVPSSPSPPTMALDWIAGHFGL